METIKDKIKIGETYKYKELCVLFNQKTKTGNSKLAQIKDWNRYFTWDNPTAQKYRIVSIKETPDAIVENKRNSIYIPDIELIILDYLKNKTIKNGSYRASMSTNQWWATLGMVNHIYTNKSVSTDLIKNNEEINWKDYDYFMEDTRNIFNRIFVRALESLRKREVINYRQEYILITSEITQVKNKDGSISHVPVKVFATPREETMILEAQSRAKVEYTSIYNEKHIDSSIELFNTERDIIVCGGSVKKYYDCVNHHLSLLSNGMFVGLYKVYTIIYSPTSLEQGISKLERETNINILDIKQHLNDNTTKAYINRVNTNYINYKKSAPALAFNMNSDLVIKTKGRRYESNYPDVQKRIADELLVINKDDDINFIDYDIDYNRIVTDFLEIYEDEEYDYENTV